MLNCSIKKNTLDNPDLSTQTEKVFYKPNEVVIAKTGTNFRFNNIQIINKMNYSWLNYKI